MIKEDWVQRSCQRKVSSRAPPESSPSLICSEAADTKGRGVEKPWGARTAYNSKASVPPGRWGESSSRIIQLFSKAEVCKPKDKSCGSMQHCRPPKRLHVSGELEGAYPER